MNLLLVEAEEICRGQVLLEGRRAAHVRAVLQARPGDTLRVGVVGGCQGRGRVLAVDEAAVRLELALEGPPLAPPPLELILALPRPIMLQRILKQATVMGMRRLHLVKSQKVEKSYFASPVLAPDKVRSLLLAGMEQARDTWLPEVRIYRQFRPFVEDVLPGLPGPGLLAHPEADRTLSEIFALPTATAPLRLAIGPEGGWSDYELGMFAQAGFARFSMGSRILHVDTAVVALMAQIDLLCQLGRRAKR